MRRGTLGYLITLGLITSGLCDLGCNYFFQCQSSKPKAGDGIDNDCDGTVDEEDKNGKDDDNDGRVDEDLKLVKTFFIQLC